jgi:hypothetical protein
MHRYILLSPLLFVMVLLLSPGTGHATILYNGSLGATPNVAPWNWNYVPDGGSILPYVPPASVTMAASAGGTVLQTLGPNTDRAGFFRNDIVQNRSTGYTLRFNLRMDVDNVDVGENDRAGFSVIALSSDLQGIELAFWDDRIFAQADTPTLFVHAEEALVNTLVMREYLLTIQGNSYSLTWTGASTPLTGSLRNYSAHPSMVYDTANFLFFGDNTTSAGADVWLGTIEFQAIPEPATWTISVGLLLGLGACKMRRSRLAA